MRYLSVCSGIEAATVAWHGHGFQPLAFSEIEKFPRQVLAHHYPDVPLHGDFTVLREQDWIGDADVLVGGTPCQAFSVAGLRNSLDDDRGNLTLEFVRLANAIDDLRPTGCGTVIVWENVPGVLSVKDNAFGCFLGALVGNDDPIVPTGGKWTSAGMVVGPKRSAAWRVLDAQYFGVAQRRRRVFVVASSRDGFDPAEVLFEREGLRRNTPPSREQGKEVAATVAQCFDRQRSDEYGTDDVASTMSARDYKAATGLVTQPIAFEPGKLKRLGYGDAEPGLSPTLRADAGDNQLAVAQPIPLDMMNIKGRPSDDNRIGRGYGEEGDPMLTITKANHHWVAQPITFGAQMSNPQTDVDMVQTLGAKNPMAVTYSIMPMNSGKDYKAREADVAQPVLAGGPSGGNQGGDYVMQSMAYASYGGVVRKLEDVMSTLDAARESRGTNQQRFIHQHMAVRRLTPRECERLQGFPDDYTAIPKAADGPRYKALGNSMAVPIMAWIGERIAREIGQ